MYWMEINGFCGKDRHAYASTICMASKHASNQGLPYNVYWQQTVRIGAISVYIPFEATLQFKTDA